MLKKSLIYTLAAAAAALGQPMAPAGAAERGARAASKVLPSYEILTIVRSAGLNPLGRPTRKGASYMLRAVDTGGQEVRVVVDGRVGEVISVTPVAFGVRGVDPLRPSVYDAGPPIYELGPPVYEAAPPIYDAPEPPVVYRPAPAVVYGPPDRQLIIAPLASPPDTILAPPETEEPGLLPPPPPRFPQRVTTVPNSKPATAAKPANSKSAANPSTAKSTNATKSSTTPPVNAQPAASTAGSTSSPPGTWQ